MSSFRVLIQCHGNDQGESWCVQIFRGDVVVATVNELADPVAARQAGEFLLFGALNQWRENVPTNEDISAGVDALNMPPADLLDDADFGMVTNKLMGWPDQKIDIDRARVNAIVRDVWNACLRRVRANAAAG